jgi:hypothetical protein
MLTLNLFAALHPQSLRCTPPHALLCARYGDLSSFVCNREKEEVAPVVEEKKEKKKSKKEKKSKKDKMEE